MRALLRQVDADPYRDAVRDAVLADDRAKLAELAGQEAALEQPPGFVAFLGESQGDPSRAAAAVVAGGGESAAGGPGPADDAGPYLRGDSEGQRERAVALVSGGRRRRPGQRRRPQQPGHCAADKGQMDEAIACFRRPSNSTRSSLWPVLNLAQAERLTAARDKLAAFQNGSYAPATQRGTPGPGGVVPDQEALPHGGRPVRRRLRRRPQAGRRPTTTATTPLALPRWPPPARAKTRPSSTTTSAPACASRPSTG